MGTKNDPGKYDCLKGLAPDEPFFVLRGQDNLAADLVDTWAIQAGVSGKCPHDKILEAKSVAEKMRNWGTRKDPD